MECDNDGCIDGWLYTQMRGRLMVFPTGQRCPKCMQRLEAEREKTITRDALGQRVPPADGEPLDLMGGPYWMGE